MSADVVMPAAVQAPVGPPSKAGKKGKKGKGRKGAAAAQGVDDTDGANAAQASSAAAPADVPGGDCCCTLAHGQMHAWATASCRARPHTQEVTRSLCGHLCVRREGEGGWLTGHFLLSVACD